jgi:hypothetical protein
VKDRERKYPGDKKSGVNDNWTYNSFYREEEKPS